MLSVYHIGDWIQLYKKKPINYLIDKKSSNKLTFLLSIMKGHKNVLNILNIELMRGFFFRISKLENTYPSGVFSVHKTTYTFTLSTIPIVFIFSLLKYIVFSTQREWISLRIAFMSPISSFMIPGTAFCNFSEILNIKRCESRYLSN